MNLEAEKFFMEIIESYTPLKRCGKEFLGHCPLHDDRHPSMRVNPDKKVWFCPVCSIGGDAITLTQKAQGLTFP